MMKNTHFPKEPAMPLEAKIAQPSVLQQPSTMHHQNLNSLHQSSSLQKQQQPTSLHQLVKNDRSMLKMSDDNVMMRQILNTHAPDGRVLDDKVLEQLSSLVETIFYLANAPSEEDTQKQMEAQAADILPMIGDLPYTIEKISCEIVYMVLGGIDAHATTVSLCNMLSRYQWDAKLLLIMAAFAFKYGEFLLLSQNYPTNQLANSMAILKQLPSALTHSGQKLKALTGMIDDMLDVIRVILGITALPDAEISQENQAMSTAIAHIPTAVYWTIRSIVACVTQLISISTMGLEYAISITEPWELSKLAHKLQTIHGHLQGQLDSCLQHLDGKRNKEGYEKLLSLFETTQFDNMKVLKALLNFKDENHPLYDGHKKIQVNLEVLRGKNVLLLISALNICHEELSILVGIHNESKAHANRLQSSYEVVWIPIVDLSNWKDEMKNSFEDIQSKMPWFTVRDPRMVEKYVHKFIKEVWHFRNKVILVVLDPQGRVVCPNAIHMMWIWGSTAFPFTTTREEALWKEEHWRLELLVDGMYTTILNWIREDKYIFLYGGDDMEWARRFTKEAKNVALAARVPLEMVYVGKSTAREKVKKAIATITAEKLSDCWDDLTTIWFFWIRLESMLYSKMQLGKDDAHDPIMREIKKLISYDKEGGWAILAKGSRLVVNGHSTNVMTTLLEYDIWKENISEMGFDRAFKDHHDKIYMTSHPCSRFELTTKGYGRIPETMNCPECLRLMEKFITFLCCHDEPVTNFFNPINDLE